MSLCSDFFQDGNNDLQPHRIIARGHVSEKERMLYKRRNRYIEEEKVPEYKICGFTLD